MGSALMAGSVRNSSMPAPAMVVRGFPKDTLALVRTAQEASAPLQLVEATVKVNDTRKRAMADKVIKACGGSFKGKTVGVLGPDLQAQYPTICARPRALTSIPCLCSRRRPASSPMIRPRIEGSREASLKDFVSMPPVP